MQSAPPIIPVRTARGHKVISSFSVAFGIASMILSYLCYRWTLFIRSVNLGENDFAGLFYMLVEGCFLLAAFLFVYPCLAAGIAALCLERNKRRPSIGTGIGLFCIALVVYGFVRRLA